MGEKLRLIHRRCFRLRLFGLKIDLIEFEFGLSDSARRSVDTPAENIEQIYNRYGVKVFVYNDRGGRIVGDSIFTTVSSKPLRIFVV